MEKKNELELAKKLAVLGWIYRQGFITDQEYQRIKKGFMQEYEVVSFI